MDYFCKCCKETGEAEVITEFVNGWDTTWEHCPNCGSDNIIRVDEMFDESEYETGEKL